MDRRDEPRFQINAPAKITLLDDSHREVECILADISATGMRLFSPESIPVEAMIGLEFAGHLVLANVRHSRPDGGRFTIGAERIHIFNKGGTLHELPGVDRIRREIEEFRMRHIARGALAAPLWGGSSGPGIPEEELAKLGQNLQEFINERRDKLAEAATETPESAAAPEEQETVQPPAATVTETVPEIREQTPEAEIPELPAALHEPTADEPHVARFPENLEVSCEPAVEVAADLDWRKPEIPTEALAELSPAPEVLPQCPESPEPPAEPVIEAEVAPDPQPAPETAPRAASVPVEGELAKVLKQLHQLRLIPDVESKDSGKDEETQAAEPSSPPLLPEPCAADPHPLHSGDPADHAIDGEVKKLIAEMAGSLNENPLDPSLADTSESTREISEASAAPRRRTAPGKPGSNRSGLPSWFKAVTK